MLILAENCTKLVLFQTVPTNIYILFLICKERSQPVIFLSHTHHKADTLQERFCDQQHQIIFEDQQKCHIQSILYRNITSLAAEH